MIHKLINDNRDECQTKLKCQIYHLDEHNPTGNSVISDDLCFKTLDDEEYLKIHIELYKVIS